MRLSSAGLDLVKGEESCRLTAYWDVTGWAIGYGHHGPEVHAGLTWTQDECDWALMQDVEWAVGVVNRYVTAPMTQGMFDALVDFVYNEGIGNFRHSTLLKRINAADPEAAVEFLRWDLVGGKVDQYEEKRRMREMTMFKGETP
jgi:lysozyme